MSSNLKTEGRLVSVGYYFERMGMNRAQQDARVASLWRDLVRETGDDKWRETKREEIERKGVKVITVIFDRD